jgi:GDPmannose 4,6-dehydratase
MDAQRDWGFAAEFVEGMYRMLEHHTPDTFVLATGQTQTVRSFVELAFKAVGEEIAWRGTGVDEVGVEVKSGKTRVRINPKFFRPAEVELLLGDFTKARTELGWAPKTSLEDLCGLMVAADIKRNERGASF